MFPSEVKKQLGVRGKRCTEQLDMVKLMLYKANSAPTSLEHSLKLSLLKSIDDVASALDPVDVAGSSPFNRISTPAGCHQSSEGLRAVFWNSRPVCLIDNHEEDLAHRQTLEQTRACVHLPHCTPPGILHQLMQCTLHV